MQRSTAVLALLQKAGTASSASAGTRSFGSLGNLTFSSLQDAPTASLSGQVSLSVIAGKTVDVTASVKGVTVKAKYAPSDLRTLQNTPIGLYDVTRTSVLHTSIVDYLMSASSERYAVLASFPDFTTMFGKDYYYRTHPEDLKKFYDAVDEYHRMYDVVTEFESLASLAGSVVPAARQLRMNTVHPMLGPSTANAAITAFLMK
jgi:hypothetical protein